MFYTILVSGLFILLYSTATILFFNLINVLIYLIIFRIIGDMAQNDVFTLLELERRPRRRKQTKRKGLQKEEFSNETLVEYNSYGVLVGKGQNDVRSYIGVIVRETFSILLDDSRRVPLEMKETLWLHFQVLFNCLIVYLMIYLNLVLIHAITL